MKYWKNEITHGSNKIKNTHLEPLFLRACDIMITFKISYTGKKLTFLKKKLPQIKYTQLRLFSLFFYSVTDFLVSFFLQCYTFFCQFNVI